MGITLYGWPRSSASRVHWALEELGIPFELVTLDPAKGEHRAPAYLAINPNGKVPALVDDDQPYFESLAILLHLAETYGRERDLWPAAGPARAEALCWTVWGGTELQCLYDAVPLSWARQSRVVPSPSSAARPPPSTTTGSTCACSTCSRRGSRDRDHMLGAFSLADIPAAAALTTGSFLGASVEGRTQRRCLARSVSRSSGAGPLALNGTLRRHPRDGRTYTFSSSDGVTEAGRAGAIPQTPAQVRCEPARGARPRHRPCPEPHLTLGASRWAARRLAPCS